MRWIVDPGEASRKRRPNLAHLLGAIFLTGLRSFVRTTPRRPGISLARLAPMDAVAGSASQRLDLSRELGRAGTGLTGYNFHHDATHAIAVFRRNGDSEPTFPEEH
jgi:hypothetical protein